MITTAERYVNVANGLAEILGGIADDGWTVPTPCDGWTAGQLFDHVYELNRSALSTAGWIVEDVASGSRAERWRSLAAQMSVAMNDARYAGATVPSPFGDLALKQLAGGVLLHDVLVHTWDLARATGQPETLDSEAVAAAFAKMLPFDAHLRGPGMFANAILAPDGADEQTRFLCFVGRQV